MICGYIPSFFSDIDHSLDLIVNHTDAPTLPEQAEMHLFEAIGHDNFKRSGFVECNTEYCTRERN